MAVTLTPSKERLSLLGTNWTAWKKNLPSDFMAKAQPQALNQINDPFRKNKSVERANREAEEERRSHEEYDAKGWDHIYLSKEEFRQIAGLVDDDLKAKNRWDISEIALKRIALHFMEYTYYFNVISRNMLHLKMWVDLPEENDGCWDAECDLQFRGQVMSLRFPKNGHPDLYDFLISEDENGRKQFETLGRIFMTLNYFLLHYGEIAFNVKEIVCKKPSKKHIQTATEDTHKVRLVKSYTLKRGWKNKVERKKAEIRCLAWGVRGHYRHYKNGRTVYIAPYVKGKEREKYAGKEYVLLPKANKTE